MARYDDYPDKDIFLFLVQCSRRSLGNFLLSRLDTNQKLVKDLMLVIEEHIDRISKTRAQVLLANLFRDHGEEIISRLTSSPFETQRKLELPYEPRRLPPASLGKKKTG